MGQDPAVDDLFTQLDHHPAVDDLFTQLDHHPAVDDLFTQLDHHPAGTFCPGVIQTHILLAHGALGLYRCCFCLFSPEDKRGHHQPGECCTSNRVISSGPIGILVSSGANFLGLLWLIICTQTASVIGQCQLCGRPRFTGRGIP